MPHPEGRLPFYPSRCGGSGHTPNQGARLGRGRCRRWQVTGPEASFPGGSEILPCSESFRGSRAPSGESELVPPSEAVGVQPTPLSGFASQASPRSSSPAVAFTPARRCRPGSFRPHPRGQRDPPGWHTSVFHTQLGARNTARASPTEINETPSPPGKLLAILQSWGPHAPRPRSPMPQAEPPRPSLRPTLTTMAVGASVQLSLCHRTLGPLLPCIRQVPRRLPGSAE